MEKTAPTEIPAASIALIPGELHCANFGSGRGMEGVAESSRSKRNYQGQGPQGGFCIRRDPELNPEEDLVYARIPLHLPVSHPTRTECR